MVKPKKNFLAKMLLDLHLITQEQLDLAIEEQKNSDKRIGQILIDLGFIKENQLLKLLSEQLHVPLVDLKSYPIDPELVKLLPEFQARHYKAIVLKHNPQDYLVGMIDPTDVLAHDEIENILGKPITIALIQEEALLGILDSLYRRADEISHFAESLSAELKPSAFSTTDMADFSSQDKPVVNMLRSIFEDAVQVNASDIHIEPGEHVLRIRLRVDGVLQEQIVETLSISDALVQRIKMMSGLNIAEKRLPQDGRFSMHLKQKKFDIRVSTVPVQFGESVVMRLLDQSAPLKHLQQLGMPEAVEKNFRQVLMASYGLLLLVGPTGSGKTSTLYAALNELNKPEDKIITVEDPIEYHLARINQVQVNTKIDLTFATILRSILRQDPDIIMIGELRDFETMEIALRAAMTGHFVLSTLHTNDSLSCPARLLDMGAKGYLIASVLRAVLAQRLVRQICHFCKSDYVLSPIEKNWLESMQAHDYLNQHFQKGTGCTYCHHTGYQGRIGVFELLLINDEIAEALRHADTSNLQALAVKQPTYRPLLQSGLDMAAKGTTTIQEIIHMAGEF